MATQRLTPGVQLAEGGWSEDIIVLVSRRRRPAVRDQLDQMRQGCLRR